MPEPTLPIWRRVLVWLSLLILAVVGAPWLQRENPFAPGGAVPEGPLVPEFRGGPERWIGGGPLTLDDLHGRVWVLKVWTFGCVNCVRSIPYANGLAERFGGEVGVLGIHAPEFEWEHDRAALTAAIEEHGVRFPTYLDVSLHHFYALQSPGWPVFLAVDRSGRVRGQWVGEVHEGTARARALEELVEALLAEPAPPPGAAPQGS